jgi:hypothetical protein
MLLVVARAPKDVTVCKHAADELGMVWADLSRRLAGVMPRVLLPAAPADTVDAMVAALEALGFVAFACDPACAPTDDERLLVRGLEMQGGTLAFLDGQGQRHRCPGPAIQLIQRGARTLVSREKVETSERRLDMGKALLTGGLLLTSKVKKETVRSAETREAFLVVARADGEPDAVIYERRIDYRFLGADMQPSSYANLERTLARLQAAAPGVSVDDRVAQPGFVAGLPLVSVDAVDLALYLVALARTRGG